MSSWAYFWIFVPPVVLVVLGLIYFLVSRPDESPGDTL